MEAKKVTSLINSGAGVAVVIVIAVAINLIAQSTGWRIDATENKVFTLSDGTRRILGGLEANVAIRLYQTRDDNAMPVFLRAYGERVEDMLREFVKASGGKVTLEMLDPKPDSPEADSAALDGVPPQQINFNESITFGISFTCIDQKKAIPFLTPDRENLLEYDIAKAIAEVSKFKKPKVGVMSSLEVLGSPMTMMMNPMMPPPQQDPWIVMSELQSLFEVVEVPMNGQPIAEDIDVLLVLQPSGVDEVTEYQIDQYLMRGGQLIIHLDPNCVVAGGQSPRNPMLPPPSTSSNLPNLLKAWGYEFSERVVADPQFRTTMTRPGTGPAPVSGVLSINKDGIAADDPVTGQMDSLLMVFAGAFEGKPVAGLTATPLIRSSSMALLVDKTSAESASPAGTSPGEPYTLALRLTGTFPTAFPKGNPNAQKQDENQKDETSTASENKDATAQSNEGNKDSSPEESAADNSLKASVKESAVILVGDVDMLFDQFAVDVQNILGQRLMIPLNANMDLLLNSVEMLAGDSNLMAVRSRGSVRRPFTVVREMEAEAESRFRDQITKLESELEETQQRLSELQRMRPDKGELLLTPEQEAELRKFEQRRAEVRNELKAVRRELREGIDALQARIKWANILGMPLLVVLAGLAITIARKKKSSAQ